MTNGVPVDGYAVVPGFTTAPFGTMMMPLRMWKVSASRWSHPRVVYKFYVVANPGVFVDDYAIEHSVAADTERQRVGGMLYVVAVGPEENGTRDSRAFSDIVRMPTTDSEIVQRSSKQPSATIELSMRAS